MRIIQWIDETGPHRVTVPDDCNDPAMGIPYGEPWELMTSGVTPEQFAKALRENGIWTIDDLRTNIKQARAAMTSLVGACLSTLLKQTREVHK